MQTLYKLPNYYKFIINHLVDTELEVRLLNVIFTKHKIKRVLDVACGIGRHAILLAKKDYYVKGIDFSPYQIKKAKDDAKKEKVKADFVLQDANNFSFPKKFDAAICMWTTLGEEPMQFRKVIRNVFTSLKSGGIFVIDNRSWEYIPKSNEQLITNTVKTEDGTVIKTKIYDRYTENFRVRDIEYNINGKIFQDLCITHTFKEKDWVAELKEAGFRKFEVYHNRKSIRIKKPSHVTIVAIK
jgi:SAM-dependent methyltransferase